MLQIRPSSTLDGGDFGWLKAKHHFAVGPDGNPALSDQRQEVLAQCPSNSHEITGRAERTELLNELSRREAPLPERRCPILYSDPPRKNPGCHERPGLVCFGRSKPVARAGCASAA